MGLIEIFAGVAYLANDFLALFSVIGSGLVLIYSLIGPRRKVPYKFVEWSLIGLIFGVAGQVILAIDGSYPTNNIGMIFHFSYSTINFLLFLSFVFLMISWILPKRSRAAN